MVDYISQIFKTYQRIQLTKILFRSVESVCTNWPVIFLSCTFMCVFDIKLCSGVMKRGMETAFSLQQEAGKRKTSNLVTSKYSETAEIIQLVLIVTENKNKQILVIRADFLNLNCLLPILDYFKRNECRKVEIKRWKIYMYIYKTNINQNKGYY